VPTSVKRENGKVWIEGVDRYRVVEALFECVRIALAARGEPYSADYVQGISGSAFRIGGICPCAPTCCHAMGPSQLCKLIGYEVEDLSLVIGPQLTADTAKLVERIRGEVDAGRAMPVFHAFTTAEWDLVYGYDAGSRQFLGRGSYAGNDKEYATADENRMSTCGEICPPGGAMVIGRKTGALDERRVEHLALTEAVRHARSRKNADSTEWKMLEGLACYDRWVREFRDDPAKKRGLGDAYCYGIFRHTHRAAAGFLREIAPKYLSAARELADAAAHFESEANILDSGEKLLWWNSPEGPDAERNRLAAELLHRARDAYEAGIRGIEAALTKAN
jgi:hypothetical protein